MGYNRADEDSMDRDSFGRVVVGGMLGRGGDESEHGERVARRNAVPYGGAALYTVAYTAGR
jgi:hypothetical protein